MKIGFALVTDRDYLEKIVEIENAVSLKYHFLSDLGLEHNLPHTTLFQGNFDDDFSYGEALRRIEKKYREAGISGLDFTHVCYMPEGWYFYCCEKTNALQELHDFTLGLVRDHIVLDPRRRERDMSRLTEEQRQGVIRYGYRYAGSAFFPHITLARTSGTENAQIIADFSDRLREIGNTAKIQRLTVYSMGPNGTHENTLDEIYLYRQERGT